MAPGCCCPEAADPSGLVDQLASLAAQQLVLALYEDVHWIEAAREIMAAFEKRIAGGSWPLPNQ